MVKRITFLSVIFLLQAGTAALLSAADEPLGTLLWTQNLNGTTSVHYYIYTPASLYGGIFPLSDGTQQTGVFKYNASVLLEGGDKFDFMHAAFDRTGTGLLFSKGPGIIPLGGTNFQYPQTSVYRNTDDNLWSPGAVGMDYYCAPAPAHEADFVLFNKFEHGKGFVLYSQPLTDSGGGSEQTAVPGAMWPVVSYDDKRVAYCRQLPKPDDRTQTPVAIGIYVADIDPETGTVSNPVAITPDTNSGRWSGFELPVDKPGSAPPYVGQIRCGRPAWVPDNETLIVPIQDRRADSENFTWNLYKVPAQGGVSASAYVQLTGEDDYDDFWPTVSCDGKFVAFVRHRVGKAKSYSIKLLNIESPGSVSDVPGHSGDTDVMLWPCFDHDNDPPNLEVRLTPADSNQPTFIKISNLEPDIWSSSSNSWLDRVEVVMQGQNFYRDMTSTVPSALVPDPPNDLPVMTLEWDKGSPPCSLALNLSDKASLGSYGDNHNYSDTSAFTAPDGIPSEYRLQIGGHSIEAFFIEEEVRLRIEILAKDNRFLRPATGQHADPKIFNRDTVNASYHDQSYESLHSISGRNVDPPYLPRISKDAYDNGLPGVSWWIEDPSLGSNPVVPGTDGAFHHIFRRPNFPDPEYPNYSNNQPYRLRIVAQDLWLNKIDVTIPIFVWDTKAKVKHLDYGSSKRR